MAYTVPLWVEWVARDSDGKIYGYELKPECDGEFDQYYNPGSELILILDPGKDWRYSLTKV